MTVSVKLFTHVGVTSPQLQQNTRFQTDAVFMLKQPYSARETISAGASATSSTSALAPDSSEADRQISLLHVQVAAGQFVRYEINPPNRSVAADANSPLLSGHETFPFGPGWTISLIEAS